MSPEATLLLVDDEEIVRLSMRRILTASGYDVIEATDGAHAVALFEKAGLDLEDLYQRAKTPGFLAVPMPTSAATNLENKIQDVVSKNVIALLPGSEAAEEVFLYMAHWDHLGTDPSIEGDGIYNGALDNASGTSALLSIARACAALKQRPRRTTLFAAVTAEESGLLGSAYYTTYPMYPTNRTVAAINRA